MLSFAEEILLLLLDDKDGTFIPIPDWSMKCALAGAVLMDLALRDRIDTDLEKLMVVDKAPTGDSILDPVLAKIAAAPEQNDAKYWVQAIAADGDDIRDAALRRLMELGVLKEQDKRFLWVFESRRYPMIDGRAEREVKLRIMGVLLSDEIPEPRDIAIICLVDACNIFDELLSERELETVRPRIEQVRKMDLIGQAMSNAVWEIQASIALAAQPTF